jgi:hypothetical protein
VIAVTAATCNPTLAVVRTVNVTTVVAPLRALPLETEADKRLVS